MPSTLPSPDLARWLARRHGGAPLAVILGGSVNGLSFARSLGRRGIPTLLLDSEPLIGTFTRYGRVVLLPPPRETPDAWVAFLDSVASHLSAPAVLFATSDAHCTLISERRDALGGSFRFIMPEAATLERILDKRLQYGAAAAAGVPVPRTYYPEAPADLAGLAAEVGYPCLIKPYTPHVGRKLLSNRKVLVVRSPGELAGAYERLAAAGARFMIQEIVPGGETALLCYLAFWDAEGRERAWLTKQKLRQHPPLYGDGSFQTTIDAPEVAELSRRLLRSLNYRGLVGVEFKRDQRDGTLRLIEINPRTVSGNQIAISAGVDLPWLSYQYLTSGTLPEVPVGATRTATCVNEEWDLQAFVALRRAGKLGFWRWARSLIGARPIILALDDPLPFLVGCRRLLGAIWSRLTSRADAGGAAHAPVGPALAKRDPYR